MLLLCSVCMWKRNDTDGKWLGSQFHVKYPVYSRHTIKLTARTNLFKFWSLFTHLEAVST